MENSSVADTSVPQEEQTSTKQDPSVAETESSVDPSVDSSVPQDPSVEESEEDSSTTPPSKSEYVGFEGGYMDPVG